MSFAWHFEICTQLRPLPFPLSDGNCEACVTPGIGLLEDFSLQILAALQRHSSEKAGLQSEQPMYSDTEEGI